jgi:MYXO-CTERM domain-containing protein
VTSVLYDGASFWVFDDGDGVRIRDDASVVDTTPIADSVGPVVAAATDGYGDILAVYSVGTDTRARMIIDDDRDGAGCAVGDYCASGLCEDGVCCDHACGGSATDCQACAVAAGGSQNGVCTVAVNGHVCRPGNVCELAGTCDGTTTTCPAPYYLPPNTVCGDAGPCTAAPLCSGTNDTCEPGLPLAGGTSCGLGGVCSDAGTCQLPGVDAGSDGGAEEAGTFDGGLPTDGGVGEGSGAIDAAVPDAAVGDGGSTADDAGTTPADAAGPPQDAGLDGSLSDGSTVQLDAAEGAPDAASSGDAGTDAGSSAAGAASGCGCRTTPREGGLGWAAGLAGVGFLLLRRRRAP